MSRLFILVVLLPVTGCGLVQRGSGVPRTVTRDLDRVDAVALSSFFDVDVITGAEADVIELTCDDNLLEYIETEVRDGQLGIGTVSGLNLNPRAACYGALYAVDLHDVAVSGSGSLSVVEGALTDLRAAAVSGSGSLDVVAADGCDVDLSVSGSGSLRLGALTACRVAATVTGSGRATLAGVADSVDATASGSGDLDASDLGVIDAVVAVSGSGSVWVRASGHVAATASGSGNIYVQGEPEHVDSAASGSGAVIVQ